MTEQTTAETGVPTPAEIESHLLEFLEARTKSAVSPDLDLFASGLVSSMFAMELVVLLEQRYGVAVVGGDLKLDNFRTVQRITELVLRLRDA
ncbi:MULTISPECIES: acyl carrier protein [Streptomyces]|uniref:Phosphopantetheine-binding protein n=1 Tax=Streptomyces hyderabadensis TaxID=598549 RepID=A0ABP9HGP9_9ACTN|nr:acyl carrier protein [Streptomyces hyderabadensis]